MTPNGIPALAAALVLSSCSAGSPRSAYDIVAEFAPNAATPCARYAYASGRTRYELQSGLMGQAFATTNANSVAREAFARCTSGRGTS